MHLTPEYVAIQKKIVVFPAGAWQAVLVKLNRGFRLCMCHDVKTWRVSSGCLASNGAFLLYRFHLDIFYLAIYLAL